jgi:hypothetical protein
VQVKLRNANYRRIIQELELGLPGFPAINQFDHLVFCGDLNYRLSNVNDQALFNAQLSSLSPLT